MVSMRFASEGHKTLTFWISAVQEAVSSQSELTREKFLYGTKMIVSIILSRLRDGLLTFGGAGEEAGALG